jgi:DnaJ-class molecular chaperone
MTEGLKECPRCKGEGIVEADELDVCPACKGAGLVEVTKEIVRI